MSPSFKICVLLGGTLLGGCSSVGGMTISGRTDAADTLAGPARMIRHDIMAPPFILASWQRMDAPGAPVQVYIEGDGLAWLSRSTPSGNPTPKTPIALSLAVQDPSPNVVYLARPCQYTDLGAAGNACGDQSYWRGKRFAPEVIASYQTALNQISSDGGFNLIGYSGGANISALLAARRSDILSLRTVAGNIDNDHFVKFHDVSGMPYSLNAANEVETLKLIPQRHFIGGSDDFVPVDIYQSFAQKMGPSPCLHSTVVSGQNHTDGWAQRWRGFLSEPVSCN